MLAMERAAVLGLTAANRRQADASRSAGPEKTSSMTTLPQCGMATNGGTTGRGLKCQYSACQARARRMAKPKSHSSAQQ